MARLTLIRVLAAIAAALASYMLVTSLQGSHVAGCGPASACEGVLASRWSSWMGVPVSAPALLLYLSLLAATFRTTRHVPEPKREKAAAFLTGVACLILGAAVWFLTLQLLVLRQICPYCLAAHIAGAAAAVLILRATGSPFRYRHVPAAAALGIAFLVVGPWINRPPTHEVQSAARAQLAQGRHVDIFGGMFRINVDEVPVIGRRDAPAVMVSLLDYTCRHCRKMHGVLLAAEQAHRGKLAILTLPMPLDAGCNKVVQQTAPPHANACQYARLALAVWRADPSKMERFTDWVFEPDEPPVLESVTGYAGEIVGEEALGRAMNDPWVEKQLAQDIAIYEATYKRFGNGAMPQLIIGDNIVFGELENGMQDFETLLADILK
jgi:uncharacterized membrane protein/protein-disulfide isomerase